MPTKAIEAKRAVVRFKEPPFGLVPNGFELKAERRKPSGEKHCDIEDIPSLTGVLAYCRLHKFNAMGHQAEIYSRPERTASEDRATGCWRS